MALCHIDLKLYKNPEKPFFIGKLRSVYKNSSQKINELLEHIRVLVSGSFFDQRICDLLTDTCIKTM